MDSEVKDTRSMIEKVFGSKEKYLAYLQEEKAQMVARNQLYTAREEGREEERQKNKAKMAEMISTMIAEGLSLEAIANITKLSREEIEAMAAAVAGTEETR